MFRCFSLLGAVAFAVGVAALAGASRTMTPARLALSLEPRQPRRMRRTPRFVRMPGLRYHAVLSAN